MPKRARGQGRAGGKKEASLGSSPGGSEATAAGKGIRPSDGLHHRSEITGKFFLSQRSFTWAEHEEFLSFSLRE